MNSSQINKKKTNEFKPSQMMKILKEFAAQTQSKKTINK
jgi:hypothetical protein